MTTDLDRQLREYCGHLEERQEAISLRDIRERTGDLQIIRPTTERRRARRNWVAVAAGPALAILVVISIWLFPATGRTPEPGGQPTTSFEPEPTTTTSDPEATVTTLPNLGLPGTSPNEPAGDYGWTGDLGSTGWLHSVVTDVPGSSSRSDYRQTRLIFAVENDCFGAGGTPVAATVAGLDGLYVEPYEDLTLITFGGTPRAGLTMGAYALPVGTRTLCVYLTWDPETTPDEVSAARDIVQSIRGEPFGEDGIRINFTVPEGWDTG